MARLLSKRIGGTIIQGNLIPEYVIRLSNSLEKLIIMNGLDDEEFYKRKKETEKLFQRTHLFNKNIKP